MGRDSDPESDDYGLPKVEIVVPDDARELEREVVAYHREVRQHRRKERWRRLGIPLFLRYGIAAPFIASAVLIALISGVLMTVIAPRQASRSLPSTAPAPVATKGAAGQIGGPLPNVSLSINGTHALLPEKIHPGIIAIVPQKCRCNDLIRQMVDEATGEQVPMYLVGDQQSGKEVHAMYWSAAKGRASTISDPSDVLAAAYHASGLTAILVHRDGVVGKVLKDLKPHTNLDLAPDLRELSRPGAGTIAVAPS